METEAEIQGSPVVLTGGNAQELMLGPNHRQPVGNRRETGGPPRPPPRADQPPIARQRLDSGTIDPLTQGFDRIMTRFDQLEVRMHDSDRRVEGLENPPYRNFGPPDDDYDSDEKEYADYRDFGWHSREAIPRNRQIGFRERRAARGGRRGLLHRRDDGRRDGD